MATRPSELSMYEPYLVSKTINGVEEWWVQQGFRVVVEGSRSECLQYVKRFFAHRNFIRHWNDDADRFESEFDLTRKD